MEEVTGKVDSTPEKMDSATVILEKEDLSTVLPGKMDSTTVVPKKTDPTMIALEKTDSVTAAPEEADSATTAPEKAGSVTATPEKSGSVTATPGKADSATIAPEKEGSVTAAPDPTTVPETAERARTEEARREPSPQPPPLPTSAPPAPPADVKYVKVVDPSILSDNLPSRQKHIMDRLTSIRENKQRILVTLRELNENVQEGETPNKELMAKMISSYDALAAQEEQYVQLMQQIVSIHENAAEDVQHDVENVKGGMKLPSRGDAAESETDGNIKLKGDGDPGGKASNEEIENSIKEVSQSAVEINNGVMLFQILIGSLQNATYVKIDLKLNGELSKLGVVTGKAVAASVMNDKLLETLQLHREKKAALDELRRREKENQMGAANEALQQVEMARLKVASEQEQIERKRKTLERLRREAQRRGIKLGPGSASEPDIVVEPQPEPKSVTEAKLRAKLQAKKKQNAEFEDDTGPPVPDDLAPAERIPPILKNEQQQQQKGTEDGDTANGGTTGKRKRKGKKGRERQQAKELSEAINSSIREKLAAIEARKERMREIRAQLVRSVVHQPPDMDETYVKAKQQLKSITEMRQQLELLREKGGELPEETAQMLELQLEAEENGVKAGAVLPETPFPESVQVVEEVRNNFLKAMPLISNSGPDTGLVQDDLSVGYRLTAGDSRRLNDMEQALQEQRQLLETIASRCFQHRSPSSSSSVPYQAKAASLRKCFLNAAPQLLIRLGNILLDLAKGQAVPELDSVLARLLQTTDEERFSGENDERRSETSIGNHEVASVESEPPDTSELIKFIRGESTCRFERELSRELTPEEASKLEQAKRQLCTGKAKLRKQQTLEKVRSRTEMAGEQKKQQKQQQQQKSDVEHAKGLESDICKIIDGIVPWIREHGEMVADDDSMRQLRDELLQQASRVCFPEGAAPSDLFKSQLSTIVDGTLSQYVSSKLNDVREELIFDISEILYNELAFFQLMFNINNLVP